MVKKRAINKQGWRLAVRDTRPKEQYQKQNRLVSLS